MRKIISLLLIVLLLCSILVQVAVAQEAAENNNNNVDTNAVTTIQNIPSYKDYLAQYDGKDHPATDVTADFSNQSFKLENAANNTGATISEDSNLSIKVDVKEAGLYNIYLGYVALKGNNIETEIYTKLNGLYPFSGLDQMSLTKVYVDDQVTKQDNRGNDIRPAETEVEKLQGAYLSDYMGYEKNPYYFYFKAGENTIELGSIKGSLLLTSLKLTQYQKPVNYDTYISNFNGKSDSSGQLVKIDAEKPESKSSPTLYASCDKSSAAVDPTANGKIKLNVFGGVGFNKPGQWVNYVFDVKEAGFYNLDIKFKQNMANGITSYRKIVIDDKVLFDDMDCVAFNYGVSWQNNQIGNGSSRKIYFTTGKHSIKIEAILGKYGDIISDLEDSVRQLNEAYRQSIMYLTATPDIYRDYDVTHNLPDVINILTAERNDLKKLSNSIYNIAKDKNDKTALLDRCVFQLNDFIKDPEQLPKRLDEFKSNISALGAMITNMSNQPLTLDYIMISSPNVKVPRAEAGFFANAFNELNNFFVSFYADYSSVGNVYKGGDNIKVWITSGRDQANVLKRLIDDKFSEQQKIGVNLKLVQTTAVLPALVAGIGPDVVLQTSNSEPVNYALRGAVYDLSRFSDYADVEKRFTPGSLVPLSFDKKLYGLPETENFLMMFYRKDILGKLGISVPQTWKETVDAITELQKNNLLFGLPQGPGANTLTLAMLVNQYGGTVYQKDTYYSGLDSEASIKAFTFMTDMFTNYKLPQTYDVMTRFRVGEMPLVIADYSLYNNLQVGAPEIRGLWGFTLVPGTLKPDGTIDRSIINTGLACMILQSTKKPNQSWSFIKWWTSSETQVNYGREMEMVLGPSARVLTANVDAMKDLPWTTQESSLIEQQRKWIVGMESVPGGYFTPRHIDNAFRDVVIRKTDPRETILEYVRVINKEIESKCKELNIPVNRKKS